MPSEVAVTLICTAEQQATVAGLIRKIELAGLSARVLVGAKQVGDALATRAGTDHELFVVCESEPVDELGFRRIESMLGKQGSDRHRLIRLDIQARSPLVLAARVVRECEELAKLSPARKPRQTKPAPTELRPVDERAGISLPAIRLDPGEQLDGDTRRIDLPSSPKLAELARRRKALRERGQGPARLPAQDIGSTVSGRLLDRHSDRQRRVLTVLGAALLAVLLALLALVVRDQFS